MPALFPLSVSYKILEQLLPSFRFCQLLLDEVCSSKQFTSFEHCNNNHQWLQQQHNLQ